MWEEVLSSGSLNQQERDIVYEARKAGIASAYTVPLHGPDMRISFVSFATRQDHLDLNTKDALSLIARHMDRWFRGREERAQGRHSLPNLVRQLSPQELEFLYRTMEGEVSKEIAYSTGVSPKTVDQ